MTLDPAIREQTYQYFLQEAPELLQALEQGLLNFKHDRSIRQVNNLMRATHTLKGAATSVGLDTIATVAHSLEDVFKALCQPDLSIDSETEALLFEGFECLRLPLVAELTQGTVNHSEILDRVATVFAQLQDRLGDCFSQSLQLPTSVELGFDVTQSIFEVGVAQRLDQIEAALSQGSPEAIVTVLQIQAEVFLGLAESLNLPGFRAIASAILAALHQHPQRAIEIAETALSDLRAGQAAVLSGDRTVGGQPSAALQQLASSAAEAAEFETELQSAELPDLAASLVESIWGDSAVLAGSELPESDLLSPESDQAEPAKPASEVMALAHTSDNSVEPAYEPTYGPTYKISAQPTIDASSSLPPRETALPSPQVRVNVKYLDQLNYAIGELLTNQNRQLLQVEQVQTAVQNLFRRLSQHQQLLNQLRDRTRNQSHASALNRRSSKKHKSQSARKAGQQAVQPWTGDSLPLIQALMDDMVQLAEVADAIDLFSRQSHQSVEQQRQLLSNTRNALIEARMMPLGEIFNRLPSVLQQLETLYHKPVELDLQGSDVLVDKAVAEKLYNPLLHLVRNAFDHAIEPVAIRQQQGKPETGKITISAHNQGRYLVIEVYDDGQGLDFEQIRQRAVEQRLTPVEQAIDLSEAQLIDLLFEPGFSTTAHISDVSGRGIGLDVVRNQIQSLRGAVTVQSQRWQGTKFVLQIPLSLTIAQLLVCEAGSQLYAFLDDSIEQIVLPQPGQLQQRSSCQVLRWQKGSEETLVPVYSLDRCLSYSSPFAGLKPPFAGAIAASVQPQTRPIVLIRHQKTLLGLEVDALLGEQELVIRPLGSLVSAPAYVHGSCILADGRLALVTDGAILVEQILGQQTGFSNSSANQTELPMLRSSLPALPASNFSRPALPSGSIKPETIRILTVDDSITTRQNLVLFLQKSGYQVLQASNGHEAVTQLQQQQIQLVICDLEMPGMNGFEFLRHLQQNPGSAPPPVLILTSRSDEKYRSLAMQLGAAAYMTKPYMEHKLLTVIAHLLEQTALSTITH